MDLSRLSILRGAACALLLLSPLTATAQEDRIEGHTLDGATFSLPKTWVLGEALPLTGTHWTTHDGDRGSVIGVKYDFGAAVPSEPRDEMDDLWLRIDASKSGAFTAELPFPEEAGWEAGETHTVHLLTGALGRNDKVRNPTLRLTIVAPEEYQ